MVYFLHFAAKDKKYSIFGAVQMEGMRGQENNTAPNTSFRSFHNFGIFEIFCKEMHKKKCFLEDDFQKDGKEPRRVVFRQGQCFDKGGIKYTPPHTTLDQGQG